MSEYAPEALDLDETGQRIAEHALELGSNPHDLMYKGPEAFFGPEDEEVYDRGPELGITDGKALIAKILVELSKPTAFINAKTVSAVCWVPNSYSLPPLGDIKLAPTDSNRKSITVKAGPDNDAPLWLSNQPLSFVASGSTSMFGGIPLYPGEQIVMTHTENVFCVADPNAATTLGVSVIVEKYYRSV